MILETVSVGSVETNCYILAARSNCRAMLIDPGGDEDKIRAVLKNYGLKAALIVNTHGHFDHIVCDDKFGVPVYIHHLDAAMLREPKANFSCFFTRPFKVESETIDLKEKDVIELGEIALEVMHVPGHTLGGIALIMKRPAKDKFAFTGDTLFYQGVGRTDLPGADETQLFNSLKDKLFKLPDDTIIYPGHGPSSTIGREKKRFNLQ